MSEYNNIHITSNKEFYVKIYNKPKSEYVAFHAFEDKNNDVELHICVGSGPDEKSVKLTVSKSDKDFLSDIITRVAYFVRGM